MRSISWIGIILPFLGIALGLLIRPLIKMIFNKNFSVVDFTTFFFLGAIEILVKNKFEQSVLPYLLIALSLFGILLAIYQKLKMKNFKFSSFIKLFWRFTFIISAIWYLIFAVWQFL